MKATANCIACYEKATGFGGHVHLNGEKVIAGWCKDHRAGSIPYAPVKTNCKGCYGNHKPLMGLRPSFIQFGFIDADGFHEEKKDKDDNHASGSQFASPY